MSLFKRGNVWWMKRTVNGTLVRRSLGVRDKRAALLKEAEYVRSLELREAGVETFPETRCGDVDALATEYEGELRRRGRSATHIQGTLMRVRRLLEGARSLAEVNPKWIRQRLGTLHETHGMSARTLNYYRTALHGFFAWLIQEERWEKNPVAAVERMAQTEPKRPRRALDRAEIQQLIAAAPRERSLVYLLSITSGLRRGEMKMLTWADIDVARGVIKIHAARTKNRKSARQVVPRNVLETIAARRGDAREDARVFSSIPKVETLRKDLVAAGIEPVTSEGQVDFHALRVTYATLLARAGVPLAQAQRLMRHSTPVLTSNVYTRLGIEDGRSAVASIDLNGLCPELCPPSVTTSRDPASNGASCNRAPVRLLDRPTGRRGEELERKKMEAPSGIEPEYTDLQSARELPKRPRHAELHDRLRLRPPLRTLDVRWFQARDPGRYSVQTVPVSTMRSKYSDRQYAKSQQSSLDPLFGRRSGVALILYALDAGLPQRGRIRRRIGVPSGHGCKLVSPTQGTTAVRRHIAQTDWDPCPRGARRDVRRVPQRESARTSLTSSLPPAAPRATRSDGGVDTDSVSVLDGSSCGCQHVGSGRPSVVVSADIQGSWRSAAQCIRRLSEP